ncbi:Protein FAR1-RELATED SEQUENCE 4 [Bienertia sinuspersici]
MPQTYYRRCLWHITFKFSANLSKEEFERRWMNLLEEHNLGPDDWIQNMHISIPILRSNPIFYNGCLRVTAFVKHLFWARIKTVQRVESMDSFFDKYVDKDTRFHEFDSSCCMAMEVQADAELEANVKIRRNGKQLLYGIKVERVFQKCYQLDC